MEIFGIMRVMCGDTEWEDAFDEEANFLVEYVKPLPLLIKSIKFGGVKWNIALTGFSW